MASVFFKKETFFVSFGNESLSTTAAGVEFNLSWSKLLNSQRVCGRGGGGLTTFFPEQVFLFKNFISPFGKGDFSMRKSFMYLSAALERNRANENLAQ